IGRAILLQIWLAVDHLCRGEPLWPFGLALHLRASCPSEAVAAQPDTIAHSAAAIADEIEEVRCGIDHDRARPFAGRVLNFLAEIARVDLFDRYSRDLVSVVYPGGIHLARRAQNDRRNELLGPFSNAIARNARAAGKSQGSRARAEGRQECAAGNGRGDVGCGHSSGSKTL